MKNLLEVEGFSVSYGKVEAVKNVSLSMKEGSITTIIGPNGAGKTTLMNALIGLLPCKGTISYAGGGEWRNSVEGRVRAGMCLVPETRELFAAMSVEDNLILGAYTRWGQKAAVKGSLSQVYDRFPRLAERRAQKASTLSGGERQMLAIGRALMAKPNLLLLDEPSLGLAPLVVADIFRIVTSLRDAGVSILLVEQNARAALRIADYGYVLELGEIALEGSAVALMSDHRVEATYLGGDVGENLA